MFLSQNLVLVATLSLSFLGVLSMSNNVDEPNSSSSPITPLTFDVIRPVEPVQPGDVTYYAEKDQVMNYTQAIAHCALSGYQLAHIKTAAQSELLRTRLPALGHTLKWFLTSAKVSKLLNMFRWGDNAGINIGFVGAEFSFMEGVSHYCLAYKATSLTESRLHATLCSALMYPLCQS